jgi:hypothetical protein
MRFIVQDYLAQLKERDELDAILPDLLRAMGWQVVKLAFKGEVEHGVDIAAVRRDQGETVLCLIQVKTGDIDTKAWDAGPNSVRATLNNLLDVPFEDLTIPQLKEARREVVLVHNGMLRNNIKDEFNGYIQREFVGHMGFERWHLDKLTELFHEHLLNERMLPRPYQRMLKRTLVFLDVPDYDLCDFKQLVRALPPDVKSLGRAQRTRLFGFVRLVLAMIRKQCEDPAFDDLSPAVMAHEYALLILWGWMRQHDFFGKPIMQEFVLTYAHYLQLLVEWSERIAPAVNVRNGLALGGGFERVEYPMRTFAVIGHLGLLTTALMPVAESEPARKQLHRNLDLLMNAVRNNPARHRPLLDNHSIDIFLGMWPLFLARQTDFAKWWLEDLLDHMAVRKRLLGRLPELYNRVDAVIEYEATDDRPVGYTDSSSLLLYMLFEFCLVLGAEDLYLTYRSAFEDTSFQVWYPPENVETILYSQEVFDGDTEVMPSLPETFEEFRLDVQARRQFDREEYSPITRGFPAILLLANKHFRTPVFPFWWRALAFPDQDESTSPDAPIQA